jgi:hypothetical protein
LIRKIRAIRVLFLRFPPPLPTPPRLAEEVVGVDASLANHGLAGAGGLQFGSERFGDKRMKTGFGMSQTGYGCWPSGFNQFVPTVITESRSRWILLTALGTFDDQ